MTRLLFAVGVWLLAGCRTPTAHSTVAVTPGTSVSLLAVYPFGFRWEEPPYRAVEMAQRLIRVSLEKENRLLVLGPSEFRLFRSEPSNAWATTNLLSQLVPLGVKPERAMVLQAWAERRVHQVQKDLTAASGRSAGSVRTEETLYIGHVELLHPSSHQIAIEVHDEVTADPFADVSDDDSDPAPQLTSLMERLTAEALGALRPSVVAVGSAQPSVFTFAFQPQAELEAEGPLPQTDPLQEELLLQSRIRYANPGMTNGALARLCRLGGGLWVVGTAVGAKLKPGDLVETLDGKPALPQTFHRAQFSQVPATAKVRRATGEEVELLLP